MTIENISLGEFRARLKSQGVSKEHLAFKCPMCDFVQSAQSFICAGAGEDFAAVEKYVGFSCVGRFTGAGSSRKEPDGKPCDWTLGGLFQFHKMEVQIEDEARPVFEIASAAEAEALFALHTATAEAQKSVDNALGLSPESEPAQ
ncbi:VVA0879 family protein [Brucella sp. TWI432]